MNAVARVARFAVADSIRQRNEKFRRIERLIFPKKFACEFRPGKLCAAAGRSRTHFRRVTAGRLRRFALRTRIERDYMSGFCESLDLALPNVRTCAPARIKTKVEPPWPALITCSDTPSATSTFRSRTPAAEFTRTTAAFAVSGAIRKTIGRENKITAVQ